MGAGTAGIFLATLLRRRGLRVFVLEAGGLGARTPSESGHICKQDGVQYRGAEVGRSFGLGGTSVLWGGQMISVTPNDMEERSSVGIEAWPVSYGELEGHFKAVADALHIPIPSADRTAELQILRRHYPTLSAFGKDFELRLSAWLPFGRRNFAKSFCNSLEKDPGLSLCVSATVTRMTPASSAGQACIRTVTAHSSSGRSITVKANAIVLCAGALESTRLLLAYDEDTGNSITSVGAPLGRFMADHLSITCGQIHSTDRRRYLMETSPVFTGGIMRTPRLELSAETQKRLAVTSAFAHFTFRTQGDTGLDVVRNLLRRRQGEGDVQIPDLATLGRAASGISTMAFWRFAHRRLWVPDAAELLLQVDIEQAPNPGSFLSLSSERDPFGRKRLLIHWEISAEDQRTVRMVREMTAAAWQDSGICKIADLRLLPADNEGSFDSLYDVYHPTGTVRMGKTPQDSTVDKNLRVWGLTNCFVLTTATFPSAGSANPGFTHLALTSRLADHIATLNL